MGYPANVVIRKDGYTEYILTHVYDPLPDLLLGPDRLVAHHKEHNSCFAKSIGYGWSDSGILADFDTLTLLYFGGDNTWEIGARKVWDAFLSMYVWPGWSVRCAPRELLEFAEELGDEVPNLVDAHPFIDRDTLERYWVNCEYGCMDGGKTSSLIVLRKGGKETIHSFDTIFITDILDHGEELVGMLDVPGIERQHSGIDGDGICSSILIDADQKAVVYWAVSQDKPQWYYAEIWNGWDLVDLGEDYRRFSEEYCDVVTWNEDIDLGRCVRWIRQANVSWDFIDGPTIEECVLDKMISSFLEDLGQNSKDELGTISLDDLRTKASLV